MRTPSALWLLLVFGIVALIVSRLSRSLGPVGIIVTIALVIVFVGLTRNLVLTRSRSGGGLDRWRSATKNVTPHEPTLSPGASRSEVASHPADEVGPSIVIIEPPDGTDQLAAKLQALDRLRADGLVSDSEYEAKRARLIADF